MRVMSNDMISVPRELLERIERMYMDGMSIYGECEEIRALLAQPNTCTKDGGQCEPVAWMYRRLGGECLGQLVEMESDNLKDKREGKVIEGRRILWPRDDYTDWKSLYSHPPAQAPVVLPERKGLHLHYDSIMPPYSMGWNACIDEIKRLNSTL